MKVDGCCEKGLTEYVKRPSAPPFLLKTYMLVEDPATDEVISWNTEGTGFVVWQTAEFARDLLPTLFKHSNFSSFVRQLNTYGFRKVATSRWEFSNDMFRRGEKNLLCEIRRKKAWSSSNKPRPINNNNNNDNDYINNNNNNSGSSNNNTQIIQLACDEDQRSSSTSSSSEYYSCLIDENKRLKKENGVLSCELSNVKNKCKELLDLVTIYTINNADRKEYDDHHRHQLLGDHERPKLKLFGVRLEVQDQEMEIRKRKRDEIISEISAVSFLSQSCK